MKNRWLATIATALALLAGCAGGDDGAAADAAGSVTNDGTSDGVGDVGSGDAGGTPDGSEPDATALPDATPDVTGDTVADTTIPDAGADTTTTADTTADTTLPDADAGAPDAGEADAGDTTLSDVGLPDTQGPDTQGPDTQGPDTQGPDTQGPDVTIGEDIADVGPGEDIADVAIGEDIADVGPGEDTTDVGPGEDIVDATVDVGFPDAGEDTSEPPSICDQPATLPLAYTKVPGFGGSEDFAMDYAGNVVLNKGGSIVRIAPSGTVHVAAPNAGASAGMVVLKNNDVVFTAGDKLKIAYASGGYDTLLAGLAYPNGMDVDQDDFVYVAEQNGGRLRKVDPLTGAFEVITDKLYNPNGVAWAPGYQRVYVGSFGGGTVHAIDRLPGGKWSEPVLFATIKGDSTVTGPPLNPIDPPEIIYEPCKDRAPGDPCVTDTGWQGTCTGPEGALDCEAKPDAIAPDLHACKTASAGDVCFQSVLGFPFKGTCFTDNYSADCCEATNKPGCGLPACQDCVCAADSYCCDTAWDGICVGETSSLCPNECNCATGGGTGTGTGELFCYAQPNPVSFCKGLAIDDLCAYVESVDTIYGGTCKETTGLGLPSPFPTHGVACVPPHLLKPPGGGGGGGGLDGLEVDQCGYVYVAEYVTGYLWRVSPDGVIYKAANLPSSWIPNIDFGRGVGGWPVHTMYVMNLNANELFALDIGVGGKWAVPALPNP